MSTFARTLRICHLYPDLLNLYGDRGNMVCLVRRLRWRGVGCEVVGVGLGEPLHASAFDLIFIGGGQDAEQAALREDLQGSKARELRAAAADGVAMLGICGGYQLLGHEYRTAAGETLEYLGVCDFVTESAPDAPRLIGNLVFEMPDGTRVVGFENHGGRTRLGPGVSPLGRVICGFGNNGEDGTEGVRDRNIFGTYAHGPALPKNPSLADAVLSCAYERKYGSFGLPELDDAVELRAHDEAVREALAPAHRDRWM